MESKYKIRAIEILIEHYGCKDEGDLNRCFLNNYESYIMIVEAMCKLAEEAEKKTISKMLSSKGEDFDDSLKPIND